MLLCRRILFKLEFGSFRRYTSTHPPAQHGRTSSLGLIQRLSALAKDSSHDQEKTDKIMGDKISELQAYKHLRTLDRPSLASLPVASYLKLLQQTTDLRLASTSSQLVEDILEFGPKAQRPSAMLQIMSSSTLPLLPPRTISLMLQCLRSSPGTLQEISQPQVAVLVHTFANAPRDSVDMLLLEVIYPLLCEHLKTLSRPRGDAVLIYTPPDIIHASFTFIDKLLKLAQEPRALKIFQILVNSGNVPSEAVQAIPGFDNFESIVRSSLVRASTHWHWRPLAERFLSPLLKTSPAPGPHAISLAIDTAFGCLDHASVADLHACRLLICQMHPISPVPNTIIRQFYDAAAEANAADEASELYGFTRSEEMTHEYSPPRGAALAWLMRHLLRTHSYLAKQLGEDILGASLPVPVQHRAYIVGGLATQGHATVARKLWSRYAAGKDRDGFVGEAALLLRMVSLYHHLIQRDEKILGEKGGLLDEEDLRQQVDDFKGFLDRILSEFSRVHSSLVDSDHRVITSQARAFFIMGEFVKGFDTLKILLERKEMPDIFDVNVTLTVMAEHDPRAAAQIVQQMIDKGLQPDHITYGTVMHHALNHGDMDLVDDMVLGVRSLKTSQLSYKSIVALIRGSIGSETSSDLTLTAKLRSVFGVIQAVGRATVVRSPHLGRYLVYESIRGNDPTMAFRFWDMLLKNNARWHDQEQVFLRRLIIRRLERHQAKSWVKDTHARTMIAQLRMQEGSTKIPY
ncbi:hypothetical protein B0H16DRAFT_1633789 [Mycena metata]|uniref:Pentatricopeptide repeat protein n=1 Tax=Mycena metata TaxID=1033252 RepID=A0AAD7M9X6_9AGAR|nr:hypothetical protein B0H16DRAFT_1633789 [Mycena metata]